MTPERRAAKEALRLATYDFKEHCRKLMPLATDQIEEGLRKKEFRKAELVRVFGELRDSIHGKPAQAITGADGGPLVATFTTMLARINGQKEERLPEPAGTNGNGNGHAEPQSGNGHERI